MVNHQPVRTIDLILKKKITKFKKCHCLILIFKTIYAFNLVAANDANERHPIPSEFQQIKNMKISIKKLKNEKSRDMIATSKAY